MATITFPRFLVICGLAASLLAPVAQAERIKDLASIAGVRQNQLMGYGLSWLDGSGDQPATRVPFRAWRPCAAAGINCRGSSLQRKVPAVMVTTACPRLPTGPLLDVTVSRWAMQKLARGTL